MYNTPRRVFMRESLGGRHSLWPKVTWIAISVEPSLHSQMVADTNVNKGADSTSFAIQVALPKTPWKLYFREAGREAYVEEIYCRKGLKKSWSIQVGLR